MWTCIVVHRASKCHLPIICTSNPSPDHTYSLTNDQLDGSSESSVGDDECNLSDVDEDFDDDDLDDDDDVREEDDDEIDEEVDDEEGFDEDMKEQQQQQQQQHTAAVSDSNSIFDFGKFIQRRSCPASDRLKISDDSKSKGVLTRGMVSRLVAEQRTAVGKHQQRSRKRGGGGSNAEEDEKQKTFEGADALLNLASVGLLSLFHSAVSVADANTTDKSKTNSRTSAADQPNEDVVGNNNNNNNNNSVELKTSSLKRENVEDAMDTDGVVVVKDEPMDAADC